MNIYNERNSAKAFLWSVFLPQILVLALITIFSCFYKDLEVLQGEMIYILSMMTISQFAFFIIYLFFAKKNKINIKTEINSGIKKLQAKNILFCVLISVIAVFGLYYVVSLFDEIMFNIFGYTSTGGGLANSNFGFFVINVILTAVVPAIMEELIFRGIIFKGLKEKGFWFATIISATMFMIVHLSISSLIYPLIMGIIFCLVVKKTGSIIYSMIVHFCNNFIVILIEYIQNLSGKQLFAPVTELWGKVLIILLAIISVVVILVIIKYFLKNASKNNDDNCLGNENQTNVVVINNYTKKQKFVNYLKERRIAIYSLIVGFAFWLLVIISALTTK